MNILDSGVPRQSAEGSLRVYHRILHFLRKIMRSLDATKRAALRESPKPLALFLYMVR